MLPPVACTVLHASAVQPACELCGAVVSATPDCNMWYALVVRLMHMIHAVLHGCTGACKTGPSRVFGSLAFWFCGLLLHARLCLTKASMSVV
jgi:hypothetical protein